jgi:hypothetical protein
LIGGFDAAKLVAGGRIAAVIDVNVVGVGVRPKDDVRDGTGAAID